MISARVDEIEGVKAAISGGAQKIVFGGDRPVSYTHLDVYKRQ